MADVKLCSFTKRFGETGVIDKLDLEIHDGEFVTLLGPSGCGKTTLLRMIAGLETVDGGELYINGKKYNTIPAQKRKLAMVFQSYALFPHLSVKENILFGMKINKVPGEEMKKKLSWAISLLHLNNLEGRLPREISGGQRQRVALARALVLDPDVLLLDEPLSNLDTALRETAMEELKRIHKSVGKTIIYVTHNQVEAMTMSERIALLNGGRIEQYDKPRIIYDQPKTVFSAEFIGSPPINMFEGEIAFQDDNPGVQSAIGFLRVDKERAESFRPSIGKKVIVGIRPQYISYASHQHSRRTSDTQVDLTAEMVENLGDRSLIVARTEKGVLIRFMITRDEEIETDQKIAVFADGRRIHLFDPQSRLNILS